MSDKYRALLLDAYKGELFGAALFGAFAAREPVGERVEKLRVLERREATTAQQLRRLVDAAEIDVSAEDVASAQTQGREIGAAALEWDGFVRGLHDALPSFLADFVELRTLATDANDPALVALIAHEEAINAFAELELAGRSDRSLAVLQWHLDSVV